MSTKHTPGPWQTFHDIHTRDEVRAFLTALAEQAIDRQINPLHGAESVRAVMQRPPVRVSTARTIRETRHDPWDWWEAAEAAAAEEEHIRAMFSTPARSRAYARRWAVCDAIVAVLAVALIAAVVLGAGWLPGGRQ